MEAARFSYTERQRIISYANDKHIKEKSSQESVKVWAFWQKDSYVRMLG